MNDIKIHPFDLDYEQIGQHRRQYKCPTGSAKHAYTVPLATLEAVFVSLSQKIHLHKASWKHILRQLDQSCFRPDQYNDVVEAPQTQLESRLSIEKGAPPNRAELSDMQLLLNKIEFSDFLRAIQRESVLRGILQEHQLYFFSFKRL